MNSIIAFLVLSSVAYCTSQIATQFQPQTASIERSIASTFINIFTNSQLILVTNAKPPFAISPISIQIIAQAVANQLPIQLHHYNIKPHDRSSYTFKHLQSRLVYVSLPYARWYDTGTYKVNFLHPFIQTNYDYLSAPHIQRDIVVHFVDAALSGRDNLLQSLDYLWQWCQTVAPGAKSGPRGSRFWPLAWCKFLRWGSV